MKVVLAMVVRDEEDILEAHLAFHLNAGVDLVLAVDHRSADGTTEILERYARDGHVRVFREEAERHRQGKWMTMLARLAATEHGADWVLLSDADEFWWPRGGTLREVLAAVPPRYGIVRAIGRYFVPLPDDDRSFPERMTVRLAPKAPINDTATPFRPVAKLAVRAHPGVAVANGNHSVDGVPFTRLGGWSPIELLHFPLRTSAQCARKYKKTWEAWQRNLRGDLARARSDAESGRAAGYYDRVVVRSEALERGLTEGTLAHDTRLRDALRVVSAGETLTFTPPTLAEDASYAVDAAVLREADLVRARRHLDAISLELA